MVNDIRAYGQENAQKKEKGVNKIGKKEEKCRGITYGQDGSSGNVAHAAPIDVRNYTNGWYIILYNTLPREARRYCSLLISI